MPQTMDTEILRDHEGKMHIVANGIPVAGAVVNGIHHVDGVGLCAAVFVPIKHARFGEVRNVVPFVRPPL